jgi:hypothetical protein
MLAWRQNTLQLKIFGTSSFFGLSLYPFFMSFPPISREWSQSSVGPSLAFSSIYRNSPPESFERRRFAILYLQLPVSSNAGEDESRDPHFFEYMNPWSASRERKGSE